MKTENTTPVASSPLKALSRDTIMSIADIKTETLDIPEWGGSVKVRGLSALEKDEYESSLVSNVSEGDKVVVKTDFANQRARLVVRCVLNEDDSLMFKPEDAAALGKKNAGPIERIYTKVMELSGQGKKAAKSTGAAI